MGSGLWVLVSRALDSGPLGSRALGLYAVCECVRVRVSICKRPALSRCACDWIYLQTTVMFGYNGLADAGCYPIGSRRAQWRLAALLAAVWAAWVGSFLTGLMDQGSKYSVRR